MRWPRFMDLPMRAKVAALLAVTALLPMATIAWLDVREARHGTVAAATDLLAARTDELAGKLDMFHRGYARSTDRLAKFPAIQELCRGGDERDQLRSQARGILDVYPESDPAIRGAAILDGTGVVTLASDGAPFEPAIENRAYVGDALRGEPVISDVHVAGAAAGAMPTIAYASPLLGPDREVICVAVLWVRAAALWDIMRAVNGLAGAASFAVLFDLDGVRIGHTYSDEIVFHPGGTLDPTTVEALVAESRFGARTRELLGEPRPFPEQFDRARAVDPDRSVFRGFAPVNARWSYGVARRLETVSWTLFYMIPEATLDVAIGAVTRQKLFLAGGLLLLALVGGSLFALVLLRRVRALTTATQAVTRGDLDVRIARTHGDELGALGTSFNAMAAQLQAQQASLNAARDELEVRVAQRTAELAESRQSLATTLDSIGDAVIATNGEGRIVRMNPVAEHLTGWRLGDARGLPLATVFEIRNEDTAIAVESPATRVLREGVIGGLPPHTELIARDGSTRPIADSSAPIRNGDGEIQGVVLVFRDQTATRRADEERTRILKLEAENSRIHEANRLKSQFLANMSHELRTPLNSIIGFADLLHDEEVGPLAATQKDFLGTILASSRHLLQLINDVLDLSKVEAGKMSFHRESTDASLVVHDVAVSLQTSLSAKQLRLSTRVDDDLGELVIDAARLRQVLYNYVSNAIKFTPELGTIGIRIVAAGPAHFRIEVEDSGIGVAPEDLGHLFVEFHQLDASVTKLQPGTGLGLALTRRLVEAQGGEVGVRSVVGVGSVFHATLPRRAATDLVRRPATSPVALPDPVGGPAVLVVEDSADDRDQIARALRRAGYAVDSADTVGRAIGMCKHRRYEALTLNLIVAGGSGLDVLRAVRSTALNADLRVMVVTVVDGEGAVAGFAVNDMLGKPFEPEALASALRRAGVAATATDDIWIVDDDPSSLKLMAATLDRMGFHTAAHPSAESALEQLDQTVPLAVVLDLMMPEMDGFAFLERFRSRDACRAVPVIIWTAKDLTASEYERLRATAQAIVAKGTGGGAKVAQAVRNALPPRVSSQGVA